MVISITFRPNKKNDIKRIAFIKLNEKEKSIGEIIRLSYKRALNISNWSEIHERMNSADPDKYIEDLSELDIEEISVVTSSIESSIFQDVYKNVKDQLGYAKPRVSFITRLCIYAWCLSISQGNLDLNTEPNTIETNEINVIEIIRKIIDLSEKPKKESHKKLLEICRILERSE